MVANQDYLLEVGCEELPAPFLATVPEELGRRVEQMLDAQQLTHEGVHVDLTPRRIALFIKALVDRQPDIDEVVKGPPASVAFDAQGQPTKAAEGFARKFGAELADLKRETIDGTDYVVCRRQEAGQPVQAVLAEQLPQVVLGLPGSHFMMWDTSEIRFSRPIRWLLSLYGSEVLPLTIGLCQASNRTMGHRFFAQTQPVVVPSVDAYKQQLHEQGAVMVDCAARRQAIVEMVRARAAELGGTVDTHDDLLDTVTMIVETPSIIDGRFKEAFLELPKPVIETVMIAHQKYFPVQSASSDGGLLPYFLTVSNNPNPDAVPQIRAGNEKVLTARLEDAAFFFNEDRKRPLAEYVENLKGMAFQKGLGSVYDKSVRLATLIENGLAGCFGLGEEETAQAVRAAHLCKADLATQMVFELTELQGVMGYHYALHSGESPVVARAIEDHYTPRFYGDRVAKHPVSQAVSVADKLDTLVAVFSQPDAKLPTGSKDPMGLRRLTNGLLATLIQNQRVLDLNHALGLAFDNLGDLASDTAANTLSRIVDFMLQRFKGYLLEQQYRYDLVDAVLNAQASAWTDVNDVIARLEALKAFTQNPEFVPVYESANRTSRILEAAGLQACDLKDIDASLFEGGPGGAEGQLYDAVTSLQTAIESGLDAAGLLDRFAAVNGAVIRFYDEVLVNADEAAVKKNRFTLLGVLRQHYGQVADFTALVV
ncbi:MAG: glycine--tRNA ligase subunit beta [Cyanobacteria bacterium HKST-UBA04]|nr:glycine--tRNA ligase subunit beta [Cyanobacteria bacterium HKST-UBA04]